MLQEQEQQELVLTVPVTLQGTLPSPQLSCTMHGTHMLAQKVNKYNSSVLTQALEAGSISFPGTGQAGM